MGVHVQIALSSDEAVFGGFENVSKKYDVAYETQEVRTELLWDTSYHQRSLCPTCSCPLLLAKCYLWKGRTD